MINNIHFTSLAITILVVVITPAHSNQLEQEKLVEHIASVNELINQADNSNSLWRETKNLFNSANKHANTGDFTLAHELLIEAEFQAKQGIQQAQEQLDINNLVPSYLQH